MFLPIRRASRADAGKLAEFAAATFRDAYGADNDPNDFALYLSQTFGVDQQTRELSNPDIVTLVAVSGGDLVAYAQVRAGEPPATVTTLTGTRPMEVSRFYVTKALRGQGIGRVMMAAVEMEAERRQADALWLGVWERNPRAQAFYRKCGFAPAGTQTFVVGTDPQTDIVMTKRLA